jgi:hypothetical protein
MVPGLTPSEARRNIRTDAIAKNETPADIPKEKMASFGKELSLEGEWLGIIMEFRCYV